MLNIGFSELLVIAAVALVAIGPKELPEVMRKLGEFAKKAKDFTNNISDSLRIKDDGR